MSNSRKDAPRKRGARPLTKPGPAPPVPSPHADEVGRALPGPDDGRRGRDPEASVEGPLRDRPDTEEDEWLRKRGGEGVQEVG
jgi:hypothetical protein